MLFTIHNCFRQKYSTSFALIHLTDKIREQIDNGNFACGIFFDLQKTFATVDHNIFVQKWNHYFQNRSQYDTINASSYKLEHINCGIPQGSILGPLLFLIYINDLERKKNELNQINSK